MKRLLIAGLFLCLLLAGCRKAPEPPPEETPVPGGAALDAVTYLPEDLLDELEGRMQDGKNSSSDFDDIRTGRRLTEEEASALPPEVLDSDHITHALLTSWESVDYDNDGVEDIFASARWGMGSMGMFHDCFFRGLPDGGFESPYYDELCMTTPMFIAWEGQNYFLALRRDQRPAEAGGWEEVDIGMQVSCFADGWEQERVYLNLDPETGEITREVYTLGVNTEFPLPTH